MHQAAAEHSLPVQYCMALPSDILSSLGKDWVTNGRGSTDYASPLGWNILESSIMFWALDLAPFKDTLWTRPDEPGSPFPYVHNNVHRDLIAAAFSTAAVGVSDGLGMTDTAWLMRAVAADGHLLQPSRPLTTVESLLTWSMAGGSGQGKGEIGQTFTATPLSGAGDGSTQAMTFYVLGVDVQPPYSLVEQSAFWPPPAASSAPSFVRDIGSFDCGMVSGAEPLPLATLTERECAYMLPAGGVVNVTVDASVPGGQHGLCDAGAANSSACHLLQIVPLLGRGWGLVGELDKLVPVSEYRFAGVELAQNGGSFAVRVRGAAGETVSVAAVVPGPALALQDVVFAAAGEKTVVFK